MTKRYFPYDAGAGANVTELQWGVMARWWLGTGVLSGYLNQMAVFGDSTGMQVKVPSGGAWVDGQYFDDDLQETLAIATADATNPRIDRVVVKNDRTANTIDYVVKTGTPAATPTAPTLTQTSDVWEMTLAQVRVNAGVTTITAGNVTDERAFAVATSAIGIGGVNADLAKVWTYLFDRSTRGMDITRTNGLVTQMRVLDGATAVATVTLTYTTGQVTSFTIAAGGLTATYTLSRTAGQITGYTKTVV